MKLICIGMAVVAWLGLGSAWAQEQKAESVLNKRFTVYGGAQIYQARGEFSSTKEGRPEIKVDMDDLDLDKHAVTPVFGALFNFGRRWNLRFDYYGYHEKATSRSEFDFNFGDLTIPVDAVVDSKIDLDVYVVNLGFNIINTERARFGVGVGAHLADIDLKLSATVTVEGETFPLGTEHADILAPLPNLYLTGAYAFTEKFVLKYGGGWMSLTYGDYDGRLLFANAFLEYWPFRYAGFGAGYRYVAADINYEGKKKEEDYDVKLPGPVLYMTVGF